MSVCERGLLREALREWRDYVWERYHERGAGTALAYRRMLYRHAVAALDAE